ncbi:alpha/beta hydrolase [Flavobacterium sp.]|uniref:alpha/beta hydrolase n=1 Tax=Flavobacterium sp. TaxID=239 RepID=UPI0035287EC6
MKNIIYTLFVATVIFTSCSKTSQTVDIIPKHDTFTLQSELVHEKRVINVWTPANYNTSLDSLPVMYMADGGIKEDFPHIANTLAELIQENKIKPIILVGIENTERRRDLSGFTEVEKDKEIAPVIGGSENFRAFIKNELFVEIAKRYRTTNKKSIIGESLSGLFVMETFFLEPEMFDNYIAFDPSLWWNNHYLVRKANEHLKKLPLNEKKLWFAGSSATDISPYTNELATIFKTKNYPNLKWKYTDEPSEKHTTIFRATKEKAIIWTLN